MKKRILIFALSLFGLTASAQLNNPGFEQLSNVNATLPSGWGFAPVPGFTVSLDSMVKHTGKYALKMVGNPIQANSFMNFTQNLSINYNTLKRIKLTAYVKTEELKGNVALWCQIWDGNKKKIGFENSGPQGVSITGTNDWQKIALNLIVGKDAKTLFFGAYTMGTGTVYFDDIAVEEFEGGNEQPTPEVLKFNREFIDIVKKHSIYADSIDWKALDPDLKSLSMGLKTVVDAQVVNNYVLQALRKAGDNHSFIQNKVAAKNYANSNTSQAKPESKLLDGGIGYISVPAYGSTNKEVGEAFAAGIQSMIKKLDSANDIKGWVVDLRGNGGGNMYPMISGLGPMLDVGELGYFVKGKTSMPWKNTRNGMRVNVKDPYVLKNSKNKIAVLIGRGTGSSGEMTAITFIGQANTRLFGEPSSGYITANQTFPLSDGSNLLLASTYVADRNKKKYLQRIFPDVEVKSVTGEDAVLKTAQAWVLGK